MAALPGAHPLLAPASHTASSQFDAVSVLSLQDHYLIERLSRSLRAPRPERVVHAKGGGAFGTFRVTADVSALTCADVFQPGRRTDVLTRFSAFSGAQDSPDTWRDSRGFAVKFYTAEGNLDLVGTNSPVFFIRRAEDYPELLRSQQTGASGLRDHDAQWDFWTRHPETAHQVIYLMGDRGAATSWREQNGYGAHTFQWISAQGDRCWVKFHWRSEQPTPVGVPEISGAEAGGSSTSAASALLTDAHRIDLHDAIASGRHPRWRLHVQVMPYRDAIDYRINPFDVTKVWPHADFPLREVGVLELDRNPSDLRTEVECAAFAPSNLVPGIAPSPDSMLLGRMFAYHDHQRSRLGDDYAQQPVNRSRGDSSGGAGLAPQPDDDVIRSASAVRPDDDDFAQAGALVRDVMDPAARDRLVSTISAHLLRGVSDPVLQRAFTYLRAVDQELGARVENVLRAAKIQLSPSASR